MNSHKGQVQHLGTAVYFRSHLLVLMLPFPLLSDEFEIIGSDGKESACNAGDLGLLPRLGRSPREGNAKPLQGSCLENSMTEEPGGLQSMGSQRVRHN